MQTRVAIALLSLYLKASIATNCKGAGQCTMPDGAQGFCYERKCIGHVEVEEKQNLRFEITVKYPEAELLKHGGASLFIRGNGLGLLWFKGKQLSQTGNDVWKTNITYKSSLGGFQCQSCTIKNYLPDNKLQYRIMVDDREDMLGANFAINFPVSQTSSYFDVVPNFISYPWFHEKTGSLQSFNMTSKHVGKRNITIYTPPSFNENTFKTYPAILVFDLSYEFANFFKRNFEDPILPKAVSEEYILIGFGDYKDSGKERMDLLTPIAGPYLDCINGTYADNCDGCIPDAVANNATEFFRYLRETCSKNSIIGGRGDNTLDFLIYEALPFANKQVKARLQTDDLGVMGYSLGGLMSCYAAWTRPNVISFAACQSPSFWWPYTSMSLTDTSFDFMNRTLKDPAFQSNRKNQKIYLDAGGAEDVGPYMLTRAVVEVGEILVTFDNFKLNENIWVAVDPFKNHSYVEWGKRMGQALATLYPAKGSPTMPLMQDGLVG